jgi:hypothetical protein
MDRRLSAITIVRLSADHKRRQDRQRHNEDKTERQKDRKTEGQKDRGICTVTLGTCQGQGHVAQGHGHMGYGS